MTEKKQQKKREDDKKNMRLQEVEKKPNKQNLATSRQDKAGSGGGKQSHGS